MRIGVNVTTTELPPANSSQYNTSTAFAIGLGDTGVVGSAAQCASISDVTTAIGPRSTTNSALWDWCDVFFREGGALLYLSRVVGTTPVAATVTLADGNSAPTVAITAKYPGALPNSYNATVTEAAQPTVTATGTASQATIASVSSFASLAAGQRVSGGTLPAETYIVSINQALGEIVVSHPPTASGSITITPYAFTLTVTDDAGDTLEVHGPFLSTASLYADTSSSLVNFAQSAGSGETANNPAPIANASLAGGTDNRSTVTISSYTAALNAFPYRLGPGQVACPGQTNTTLAGIWAAIGNHSFNNNRVALADMDVASAATLVADFGSFATNAAASWCSFWAATAVCPGVVPNTTRTVPISAGIAGKCAQADATGNPNTAAAGDLYAFQYINAVINATTGNPDIVAYEQQDIDTLNEAGINTVNTVFSVLEPYGFVSAISEAEDDTYWQFSCSRFRMALVALFEQLGAPFNFSNITQADITNLNGQLATAMSRYVNAGAIFTQAPDGTTDQGFVIDTGPTVNTTATIAAGELNAKVAVRMTKFAQTVNLALNTVPLNQSL